MLTFSICVLFQTSSKKACETNKTHKQLDNVTKQRDSSVEKTFTISEDNRTKKELWTVLKTLFYVLIDYLITI